MTEPNGQAVDQSQVIEGLQRDLAECRKREMLLRSVQDKLEAELRIWSRTVEQSPISIVITNVRGEIEYVNS